MRVKWDAFGNLEFSEVPSLMCSNREWLAEAEKLHDMYLAALNDWSEWLQRDITTQGSTGPRKEAKNAAALGLDYAIRGVLERLRAGAEQGNSDLPSEASLRDRLSELYETFHETQANKRLAIETMAEMLVLVLEESDFIDQYNEQPWDEQLTLLARVSDRLHESNVGKAFLKRSIERELVVHETIPIFHLARLAPFKHDAPATPGLGRIALIEEVLNLAPLSASTRQADVILDVSRFYQNLMPIVCSDTGEVLDLTIGVFQLLVKDASFIRQTYTVNTFGTLLEQIETWRASEDVDATMERFVGPGAKIVTVFLSLAGVAVAMREFPADSTTAQKLNFAVAVKDIAIGVYEVRKLHRATRGISAAAKVEASWNAVSGVLDAVAGTAQAVEGVNNDHFAEAFSGVLIALGGYTVLFGWVLYGLEVAVVGLEAASLFTLGVTALIGLALQFTAVIVMWVWQRSKIEEWFDFNFFGDDWDSSRAGISNPDHMIFGWAQLNGRPHLRRQAAELHSIFFPLFPEDAPSEWEVNDVGGEKRVGVEIRPRFVASDGTPHPFLRGEELISVVAFDGTTRRAQPLFVGQVTGATAPRFTRVVSRGTEATGDGQWVTAWFMTLSFAPFELPSCIEVQVAGAFGEAPVRLETFEQVDTLPMASIFRRRVDD